MQAESAHQAIISSARSAEQKLLEKKRTIRALKRVLIAKAEMRRLKALMQAKSMGSRR